MPPRKPHNTAELLHQTYWWTPNLKRRAPIPLSTMERPARELAITHLETDAYPYAYSAITGFATLNDTDPDIVETQLAYAHSNPIDWIRATPLYQALADRSDTAASTRKIEDLRRGDEFHGPDGVITVYTTRKDNGRNVVTINNADTYDIGTPVILATED